MGVGVGVVIMTVKKRKKNDRNQTNHRISAVGFSSVWKDQRQIVAARGHDLQTHTLLQGMKRNESGDERQK